MKRRHKPKQSARAAAQLKSDPTPSLSRVFRAYAPDPRPSYALSGSDIPYVGCLAISTSDIAFAHAVQSCNADTANHGPAVFEGADSHESGLIMREKSFQHLLTQHAWAHR